MLYADVRGEPGRNDVVKLWIDGVLATPADGRLAGGNIQVRALFGAVSSSSVAQ